MADDILPEAVRRDLAASPLAPVLEALGRALAGPGLAVLAAPPGAGKSTLIPPWVLARRPEGRVLMLEPRRLAARAVAGRIAALCGEATGGLAGYRVRGEARVSPRTRIEVVTEGILTRMIQDDPDLPGIATLIFDEFHERSLHADLGLALALELRAALRPDLALIVMSATPDLGVLSAVLPDAPVLEAAGRSFPVETRWSPSALEAPAAVASEVRAALAAGQAGILAFLPGEGEIRRAAALLKSAPAEVLPLYGALPAADQARVLAPPAGPRAVLATAIAETSLTLPGITCVIDAGLARRARFDPGSGMARLVTERASRAESDQRRGRAGRTGPGLCIRLWPRAAEGALPAFAPPEIAVADLAGLALELALWGGTLRLPEAPPEWALANARGLLARLGALDAGGRITPHGRDLARAPVHPRLAHMLLAGGGGGAAALAALLSDRDLLHGGDGPGADLALRLEALGDADRFERSTPFRVSRPVLARLRAETRRLARLAGPDRGLSPGALLALAYPDRIGLRRGEAPRYHLSGGRGAAVAAGDPLGFSPMVVAADLDGEGADARLRLGLAVDEAEIRSLFAAELTRRETCRWSPRDGRILARSDLLLGALVLESRPWDAPPEARAAALAEALRAEGIAKLAWRPADLALRARAAWARARGADLPDLSDGALGDDPAVWLAPVLARVTTLASLLRADPGPALHAFLGRPGLALLDRVAPAAFTAPTGRSFPIDYAGERPKVSLRVQELFGLTRHPVVGPDRTALTLELLSPGGRPVQTTADLPGFWSGSWGEVRRVMRGRYPRHDWPENPAEAAPRTRPGPRL
jgi:ATP-dependent helicase HrpB